MKYRYKITTQKEADISDETIYAHWQQSFRQWIDNGLSDPSLSQSLEYYKKAIRTAIVFVVIDTESGELLGSHVLQKKISRKQKYAHGYYLAVSQKAKHTGIATRMLQYEVEYLKKTGYKYIVGSTAVPAVWSVNWHLKNGYRIIGYNRSPTKNHSEYFFRKQLAPSLIWSGPLAPITARICFLISYAITILCKTSTGQLNLLGKIAKRLFRD